MRRTLIMIALFATAWQNVQAAPDTPPSLSWEQTLQENALFVGGDTGFETNPCSQFADEATRITSVRVGKDGFPWTIEECKNTNNPGFIVKRFTPAGVVDCFRWFKQPDVAVNDESYTPASLAVDPDSRAWVWYTSSVFEPDPTLALTVLDDDCDVALTKSNTQFSSSNPIGFTTFNETGVQTFRAYAGGGLSRIGYECTSAAVCTELFEINGDPGGGAVHHGAPYNGRLYGFDNNAGTWEVQTLNLGTGAVLDSESAAETPDGQYRTWVNGGNASRYVVPYSKIDGGFHEPRWGEYNASTLTNIRTVNNPIEHQIFTYDEQAAGDAIVDGAGNVFFCGSARSPGVKRDSFLEKFNNTAFPGMRWNVTISKQAGDANVDRALSCDLADDGSIYLGILACSNADSSCTSYLRKYAGAGVGRTPQSIFQGYDDSTTTTAGEGNLARQAADNCSESWGFDCGWLFAMAIIVGIGVIVARRTRNTLLIAVACLAATIAAIKILGLGDWLILLVALIIIAVAGSRLFGGKSEDEE